MSSKSRVTGNVLGIRTQYPTLQGTPDDDSPGSTVNVGSLKTTATWPDNWRPLTPRWKAQLLARLVKKVIDTMLVGDVDSSTRDAFKKITGWKF